MRDVRIDRQFRPMTDAVPCVLCLGNFDGVHKAHAMLVHAAVELAGKLGAVPGAFCFTRPSGDYLFENAPPHLASTHRRISLLFDAGAQLAIVASFPIMREMSAEQFLGYLEEQGCVGVVCGDDFRFGKKAAGNAQTLIDHFGKDRTVVVPPQTLDDGQRISSSAIRAALGQGNAERAAQMLGRSWTLCSKVYHGKHLGSDWGFPTANQKYPSSLVSARFGVYAVVCRLSGKEYGGVANIGIKPTVDNCGEVLCEVYLFGYNGDCYGEEMKTELVSFIRPEQKFDSLDLLRAQVDSDKEAAKKLLKEYGYNEI